MYKKYSKHEASWSPAGLPFLKRQALLRARDEAMLQIEREDEERAKKAEARLAQMRSRN